MSKLRKAGTKLISLICIMSVALFSSCSGDDDTPEPYKTGEEAVATFRENFYKGGKVNAIKLDNFLETEWAIPIDNPEKVATLFNRLTGMKVALTDSYNYSYQSVDKKCSIRVEGKKIAENAVYATMYINITECPEISKVILATPEYFKGTNSELSGYVDII